jgi:hypothetical protein
MILAASPSVKQATPSIERDDFEWDDFSTIL